MKKISLYIFLALALIITSLFIFDFNKRFLVFKSIIPIHNIYKQLEIRSYLRQRNYLEIKKSVKAQLELSKKYGKNKTGFTNGINDVMEIIYGNVLFKKEYAELETISREWAKLNPNIYMANIFYAKTIFEIYIKGEKKENIPKEKLMEIKNALFKAIEISNSREEAYRIGVEMSYVSGLDNDLNLFCNNYYNSHYGGNNPRTHVSQFYHGYSFSKLAIYTNDKPEKIILGNDMILNKKLNYEFNFSERKNINRFNLLLSTLPGTIVDIEKITLTSDNEIIIFNPADIFMTSKNTYVLKSGKEILSLILTGKNTDEIISFYLNKNFSNIENISITMNFRKADILNLKNNFLSKCNN